MASTRTLKNLLSTLETGANTEFLGRDMTMSPINASGVLNIAAGIGIDVDSTIPYAPVIKLTDSVQVSLGRADSAVQPGALAEVATSGSYADLSNKPVLTAGIGVDVSAWSVGLNAATQASLVKADAAAPQASVDAAFIKSEDLTGTPAAGSWYKYPQLNTLSSTNATRSQNGDYLRLVATTTNSFIQAAVSFSGLAIRYVAIRYKRTSGTHEGSIFYTTGGHGFSSLYTKTWPDPGLNVEATIVLDMWDLTAGGTDWKDNTITAIRFDMTNSVGGTCDVKFIAYYEAMPAAGLAVVNADIDTLQIKTPWITPEMFGAVGDGVTDDTTAVQACIDAIGASGRILLSARYVISSQILVQGKSIIFEGRIYSGSWYSGFIMAADGQIKLLNSSGCRFEKVGFRAASTFADEHDMILMEGSSNTVFLGAGFVCSDAAFGRYIKVTKSSNRTRFIECQFAGARGEYGLYLGGPLPSDTLTGANIFDFSVCSIGALDNCDAIVFDGSSGSARFTNCAFNFGRRAIWGKSSGFLYFSACGFENHTGDYTIDFEQVGTTSIEGCYLNGGLRMGPLCADIRLSVSVIRASKYHGLDIAGAQAIVSACNITRNSTNIRYESSGIKIRDTAKNVSICGNNIVRGWTLDSETGVMVLQNGLQKYAIDNDAPATSGVLITGNLMSEFETPGSPIGGAVPTGPNISNNIEF